MEGHPRISLNGQADIVYPRSFSRSRIFVDRPDYHEYLSANYTETECRSVLLDLRDYQISEIGKQVERYLWKNLKVVSMKDIRWTLYTAIVDRWIFAVPVVWY
jgi:hypothetical protein